ncbi:MAG: hypothetical protein ABEI54_04015 [Candidatus Bipolaricaulia bacterium]
MKRSRLIASLVTVSLILLIFIVGYGDDSYKLFLSNKGTYVRTSISKNMTVSYRTSFIPNSYFFFYDGEVYRLEKLKWEYRSTRRSPRDLTKLTNLVRSEDLILHKVTVNSKTSMVYFHDESSRLLNASRLKGKDLWDYPTESKPKISMYADRIRTTEVHPTFVGDGLVSYIVPYHSYSGGAHGVSDYHLNTYSIKEGKHLTLSSLFEDWNEVKDELANLFTEWWNEKKQDFIGKKTGPGKDTYMMKDMVEGVSKNFYKEIQKNLGDREFALTSSEVGTRINIYFKTYTLGPNVAGGSWVSLPIGNFSGKLYAKLKYRLPKVSSLGKVFRRPDYIGKKTRHLLAQDRPSRFNQEFLFYARELKPDSSKFYLVGKSLLEIGDDRGLFKP